MMKHPYHKLSVVLNLVVAIALILPLISAPAIASNPAEVGFIQTGDTEENPESTPAPEPAPAGVDARSGGNPAVYLPMVGSKETQEDWGYGGSGESWPTLGANPARTSWSPEGIPGKLRPVWYKPFRAYILPRVQPIADGNTLYISTSAGLYAIDAKSGSEKWIYPTEFPLGHSPTLSKGVAYVGGFDHRIHAINAENGQGLWTFQAGAGFDTNPLVLDGMLYAGNRDGYFYAIYTEGSRAGELAWRYQTGGPIHFSAAYKDGVVYFASDDSHAYALNANSGSLIWKSEKLPGSGFHSFWPVVYGDWIILGGSNNYRFAVDPGPDFIHNLDEEGIFPNHETLPKGTLAGPTGYADGPWVKGTKTLDTSKPNPGKSNAITEYLETHPYRRTYLVLNRANGDEYTTDFDKDGKPEFAPFLWFGNKGNGNRYPPIVGTDGVLYQPNMYKSDKNIGGGHMVGWTIGSPHISLIDEGWNAVDESLAYTAGGKLVYFNRCCDRNSGSIDVTNPGSSSNADNSWMYFSYNLPEVAPGYNQMTYNWDPYYQPMGGVFGGRNGSYGWHGDESPPIPYKGRIYMIRSNALLSFGPGDPKMLALPVAEVPQNRPFEAPVKSEDELKRILAAEVEKMLKAGHLRPAYSSVGIFDLGASSLCGDHILDYWHSTADTIYTLTRALPYLSGDLQTRVRAYLQNEYKNFPPYDNNHNGYREGAPREVFILPPDVASGMAGYGPQGRTFNFEGWMFNPYAFYGMWKYAQVFGGASQMLADSKDQLENPPSEAVLRELPQVHNAYIAGYWGYLELQKLAGQPEDSSKRAELNRLLSLRASTFTKDAPDEFFDNRQKYYCRTLNVSRNFMFMVPELADYLEKNAQSKVAEAVKEYDYLAPYWFVSRAETAYAEGVMVPVYDRHALFQVRAMILNWSQDELSRYIDIPSVPVGDLYYMDNIVSALKAGG